MANDDKVKVLVTITERVRYSTIVEMPKSEFEMLDKGLYDCRGRELREVEQIIGEYCDRIDHWVDADDVEVDEFRVVEEL